MRNACSATSSRPISSTVTQWSQQCNCNWNSMERTPSIYRLPLEESINERADALRMSTGCWFGLNRAVRRSVESILFGSVLQIVARRCSVRTVDFLLVFSCLIWGNIRLRSDENERSFYLGYDLLREFVLRQSYKFFFWKFHLVECTWKEASCGKVLVEIMLMLLVRVENCKARDLWIKSGWSGRSRLKIRCPEQRWERRVKIIQVYRKEEKKSI